MAAFQAEWLLRVLCSVLIGFMIGHERHRQSKSAGIRTHAIVAMASCLVMLVSKYAFADSLKNDPARLAASVVSGVGFLGAGIIFMQNGSTHGLTTAAGVWATSAIGLTFGAGMYELGFFCGILMYLIATQFQRAFSYTPPYSTISIVIRMNKDGSPRQVNDILLRMGFNHSENRVLQSEEGWDIATTVSTNKDLVPSVFIEELKKEENVIDVICKKM
ncbi:MAG: MgtC/SapB family protein [Erysipelotrichaceae bacterium]|nr:MgtC/SapB family protein [Erysipelotrichaceae bacterium]